MTLTTPLIVVDCETTGLEPDRHEVFELAWILRNAEGVETERSYWLPATLAFADDKALELNRFEERFAARGSRPDDDPRRALRQLALDARGLPFLGMNPTFDIGFLLPLMHWHGVKPTWHYSVVDVKALIAGHLRIPPPWRSEQLAQALGIDPGDYERHSALGDCRYTLACYDRVYGA